MGQMIEAIALSLHRELPGLTYTQKTESKAPQKLKKGSKRVLSAPQHPHTELSKKLRTLNLLRKYKR